MLEVVVKMGEVGRFLKLMRVVSEKGKLMRGCEDPTLYSNPKPSFRICLLSYLLRLCFQKPLDKTDGVRCEGVVSIGHLLPCEPPVKPDPCARDHIVYIILVPPAAAHQLTLYSKRPMLLCISIL